MYYPALVIHQGVDIMSESLGKKAEKKIQEWLDKPEYGYCFDRIPDQMSGLYGSKNICDFTLYRYPYMYYIESKATEHDRFDFTAITDYQMQNLLEKSKIAGVRGVLIVLFAVQKRAFIFNILHIQHLIKSGKKSLNIQKIEKWGIPFREIETVRNSRKTLLDYQGNFDVCEYTPTFNIDDSVAGSLSAE